MFFQKQNLAKLSVSLLISILIISINLQASSINDLINPFDTTGSFKKPKNIILMIGDGMGVSQVYAGMTVNHGKLNLERCTYIGFSKTYSADDYITDSAAGATAMSTGKKTKNGFIGVDTAGNELKTILEIAEDNGLATGLVATSSITHATPASFIAHYPDRHNYEILAKHFLDTDIDVFIGGGKNNFEKRKDTEDLIKELIKKDYLITDSLEQIINIQSGKLAGFISKEHPKSIVDGRGDMLEIASNTAINILKNNRKGFFLMIEGSQIDWGGHENNTEYVVSEMLDFDKAIGKVLDFARDDGNTLVIITADHETGGMGLNHGDFKSGEINAEYTTHGHTGVMVPVFAFGPGAENFAGIYENTEIFFKMVTLFGFKIE